MLAPHLPKRNASTPHVQVAQDPRRDRPTRRRGRVLAAIVIAVTAHSAAYAQSPLTNGGNHAGSISTPGELDRWAFTAAQNDAIVLSIGEVLGAVDPGFWPWIRLVGPNGTQLASSWGALAAYIQVTAPLTGTYIVTVSSADTGNDATGSYLLTLAKIPGTVIVPSDDQGGPMTNGANHTGRIHLGDLDQWTFTAAQHDSILLSIGEVLESEIDPGFWPWIRLYGPNGALIASNWGNWVAYMAARAPLSGTYTVVVGTADTANDATGDYRLTLARIPGTFVVPTGDQGGAMTNGANHAGRIHLGDLDRWTFTASQNDAILLSIGEVLETEIDPGFWPWIRLYGPNGALIASNWGNWVAYLSAAATLSGTYTVVVGTADTANDAMGDYQLTLAKIPGTFVVPSGDQGGAMTNGANHAGEIHLGDLDRWTFNASQNDAIVLSIGEVLESEIDPGFWPWVRLYGPNGALIASNWGNWVAYLSATAPLTGTYTVVVGTADTANDATGDYLLTLAAIPGSFVVPTGDEGGSMSNGVNHSGAIHRGDLDRWTFHAAQSAAVIVSISEVVVQPDPGFWPWIRIFGPTGSLVRSVWGDMTAQASFTAPLTGTYTVIVGTADTANDAVGRYVIRGTGITLPMAPQRVAIGLGPTAATGGWFAMRSDRSGNLAPAGWGQLPWSAYNAGGGGLRLAAGDVDGDGLDEIIAGLDRRGGGWFAVLDDAAHGYALLQWIRIQWPAYNTVNGEVWPAAGDIDGDGRAEIVAGLGAGGYGWFEVFDDASAGFRHLTWRQVAWPAYANRSTSIVHPAVGNVDGAGASEIILGLGNGSSGWIEVVNGAAGGYNHRSWMQVAWAAYNSGNGTTFPAAGDVDGDGRDEVVAGLGAGSSGWIEIFDDANGGYAHLTWLRVAWAAYNQVSGETHPAVGNIDGDTADEIVVGLGFFAGQGGWFETFDDESAEFVSLGWRNVDWTVFRTAGGATYPAIGRFR